MPALSLCTASPHFFLPSLSLPLLSPFPPCKLFLFYLFPVENSQSRGQTLRESTLKAFRNWSSSTYPKERSRTPQRGLTWIIRRKGNSIIFFSFPSFSLSHPPFLNYPSQHHSHFSFLILSLLPTLSFLSSFLSLGVYWRCGGCYCTRQRSWPGPDRMSLKCCLRSQTTCDSRRGPRNRHTSR